MLLVIDIGNTNIVLGVYRNEILIKNWRIRTNKNVTEDEFAVLVNALFNNSRISILKISQTIVSCVVPSFVPILNVFCKKYFNHLPYLVNIKSCTKMPILIDNPSELGADRIVNSIAAYFKYKKSLIIVDFGTATTFDCISDNGEYLGGAISPGINISSNALFESGSKLPYVDIFEPPNSVIGKDTVTSIRSGIFFGYAGLVDGIVKRIKKEMVDDPTVVATGGLAFLMQGITETIEVINPVLILDGLRIISADRTD